MNKIITGLIGREVEFFLLDSESMYRGTIKAFDGSTIHFSDVAENDNGKWKEEGDIITSFNPCVRVMFLKKDKEDDSE